MIRISGSYSRGRCVPRAPESGLESSTGGVASAVRVGRVGWRRRRCEDESPGIRRTVSRRNRSESPPVPGVTRREREREPHPTEMHSGADPAVRNGREGVRRRRVARSRPAIERAGRSPSAGGADSVGGVMGTTVRLGPFRPRWVGSGRAPSTDCPQRQAPTGSEDSRRESQRRGHQQRQRGRSQGGPSADVAGDAAVAGSGLRAKRVC
jgi:hypothetical protein